MWDITERLETTIISAIKEGYDTFITGMAPGFDIEAGVCVAVLKEPSSSPFKLQYYPHIRLVCAIPYEGFLRKRECIWRKAQQYLLKSADEIVYVCPTPHRGSYQIRNKWMVDHSTRVIAYYNGTAGGTKNTIVYAQKKNIPVVNLYDCIF